MSSEPSLSAAASRTARREQGETAAMKRWEKAGYWPLIFAALAFFFAITFQVVGNLTEPWSSLTWIVVAVTWLIFLIDYVARLIMSHPRGTWFRRHLFDAAVVVVPTLQAVRLLRVVTRLVSRRGSAGDSLRASLLVYGFGSALLLIWQASLAVLSFERNAPGANITTFEDTVWWAFCTVSTVGYGDFYPVTTGGRTVAIFLMMGGVILVGLIVASFSSWVAERVTRGHEEKRPATRGDVMAVMHEVQKNEMPPAPAPGGPGTP
ncbi:potassium channel family protein [Microbacterium sp. P05]|uniref:potassium channel family protein n=1 Tax=Microbacterium sp. P05 TaxID=3366948 RepID=UPI003745C496